MPEELRRSISQAVLAAWNEGKVELLDEHYAEAYVRHAPPFPMLRVSTA